MSAASSNSSDRDGEGEALRRAQRAHEPSMEEILASIRSIIADDREHAKAAQAARAQRGGAAERGPQIVYSKPADPAAKAEPAGQSAPVRPEPGPVDAGAPKVVWRQPEARGPRDAVEPPRAEANGEPVPAAPARADAAPAVAQPASPATALSAPEPEEPAAPLVSAATEVAVTSSFDALSATLAARADETIRDLLRPMLRTWLDDNLPALVERLVAAEIERIARGPKG